MIVTCAAILAVDFPAFPRRLAKAEAYGLGLMDVGVGSFVAAGGFARGLQSTRRRDGSHGARASPAAALVREGKRAGVLLALGLSRTVLTWAIGYQQHVGEYGVHWNFFVTLAAVHLCSLPVRSMGTWMVGMVGAALLGVHDYCLRHRSWELWALAEGRGEGIVEANKEGLASLLGYCAIHVLSHWAARLVSGKRAGGGKAPATTDALPRLAALTAAAWAACVLLRGDAGTETISRRSCNAAYVLVVMLLNLQAWLGFAAALALSWRHAQRIPTLLREWDAGSLSLFLVANLATGAVNTSLDTLHASAARARTVLLLYVLFLCAVAAALHARSK
ncbi:hypothetical protein H632_c1160p0 [Helicosporidium sp. ATCC 50920]|nr:hypothetical protein H632_c1160p0 [Helicosporidium sp. ATCC 50920]|eukprot:KDD74646.1 hypothetical protein H632_c1160p0 [Helicosporidium sp. ATCC 50920]